MSALVDTNGKAIKSGDMCWLNTKSGRQQAIKIISTDSTHTKYKNLYTDETFYAKNELCRNFTLQESVINRIIESVFNEDAEDILNKDYPFTHCFDELTFLFQNEGRRIY